MQQMHALRLRAGDGSAEQLGTAWEAPPEEQRNSFVTPINGGANEGSRGQKRWENQIGREEINRENARELEQDAEEGGVQSQSKEVKIR